MGETWGEIFLFSFPKIVSKLPDVGLAGAAVDDRGDAGAALAAGLDDSRASDESSVIGLQAPISIQQARGLQSRVCGGFCGVFLGGSHKRRVAWP